MTFSMFALAGMMPGYALAHGDFVLLYSLASIAFVHLGIAFYILFSRRFKKHRLAVLGMYLASAIIIWSWAMGYRGPDFPQMYTVLTCGPILILLCVIWLRGKIAKRGTSTPEL